MELPISTSLPHTFSRTSMCRFASTCSFSGYLFRLEKRRRRLNCCSKPLRVELSLHKVSSLSGNQRHENREDSDNIWKDPKFVEVIGIGSRKDAALDFCLDSSYRSSALRFWNILVKDTVKVQLQQRCLGKDVTPRIVEAPLALQSCSKAVVLVACAAYGSDHEMAIDILKIVKSANGLVVGIILKPFSFEGRRRQDEVNDLVDKLQELTNFCIMVDTDALLEKELVTLDEALKTANNAVLMAMNAISIIISEIHIKFLDVPCVNRKEIKVPEIKKILRSYRDAKIGFGAGYNIKTSIVRAIYECPFLGVGIKDSNAIVVCILASSGFIDHSDLHGILSTFRQTTECQGEVIFSAIHEPNLEPNLIVTTIITLGYIGLQTSQKGSIFSRLVQHFPFIFNFLGKQNLQSHDSGEMPNIIPLNGTAEGFGIYSAELHTLFSNSGDEIYSLRDYGSGSERSEVELSETNCDTSTSYDQNTEGAPIFERELLIRQNIGPGYHIAQEWTSEGANNSGDTPVLDILSIYKLPIGVKPSEEFKDGPNTSSTIRHPEKIDDGDMKAEPQVNLSMPWDVLTDASYEALMEFYNNASALLKGNNADPSKKQGVLSVRAASMLEAERDSQKKWSPIVEIKYRGGLYMGCCQGGLPEGKGRLSLEDGSMYDGMWRYGKRSGLGTVYFSNGDVFWGSWRDDIMHGKGWFYFHTGDRWFVNLWKGKANGEGRFYSKNGDILFGHFKDGWRHGHFLCINISGARFLEIWDEGVLISRKQLDCDDGAGAG